MALMPMRFVYWEDGSNSSKRPAGHNVNTRAGFSVRQWLSSGFKFCIRYLILFNVEKSFFFKYRFFSDNSHTVHFETTCNSYDWRSRCLRCTAKSAIKSVIAAQKAAIKSERSSMQTILPGFKKNDKGELVPKRKYKKKTHAPSDFYSDDGGSGSSTPYLANSKLL